MSDNEEYGGVECAMDLLEWLEGIDEGGECDMHGLPPQSIYRWLDRGGRLSSEHVGEILSMAHMHKRDAESARRQRDDAEKRSWVAQSKALALDIDTRSRRTAADLRSLAADLTATAARLEGSEA